MKDRRSSPTTVTSTASTSSSVSALVLRLDFKLNTEDADVPVLSLELKKATSDALIDHLCAIYEDTKKRRDADVDRLRSEFCQVQQKDDELRSYRAQNDELGQEVKNSLSVNAELQNELQDIQQELQQLLEDNERLQQECDDQHSYADKIEALCLRLKEEAKQARSKIDSLVRDNESMQSAIRELDDKKYRIQLAAHANCDMELQQLEHENAALQDKVTELEAEYERLQMLFELKSNSNKMSDTAATKAGDSRFLQTKAISRASLLKE